jgi:histidine ammonia-lyase
MGTVAVRHARRLLENARRVVAIELLAAAEAVDLVGTEGLGPITRAAHERLRGLVPPLLEDRPLGADVERLAGALGSIAG